MFALIQYFYFYNIHWHKSTSIKFLQKNVNIPIATEKKIIYSEHLFLKRLKTVLSKVEICRYYVLTLIIIIIIKIINFCTFI